MRLAPGVVVVRGNAVNTVLALVDVAIHAHRRDGIVSAHVAELRRFFAAAAAADSSGHRSQAGSGHEDVRKSPGSAGFRTDEITTSEVAQMLDVTHRHASRLAVSGALGPSRVLRKRRLVSKAGVELYDAVRQDGRR